MRVQIHLSQVLAFFLNDSNDFLFVVGELAKCQVVDMHSVCYGPVQDPYNGLHVFMFETLDAGQIFRQEFLVIDLLVKRIPVKAFGSIWKTHFQYRQAGFSHKELLQVFFFR